MPDKNNSKNLIIIILSIAIIIVALIAVVFVWSNREDENLEVETESEQNSDIISPQITEPPSLVPPPPQPGNMQDAVIENP